MRVNGRWLVCDDGTLRPTIQALVRVADGALIETTLLLDAVADRTVFSARLVNRLRGLQKKQAATNQLAGVGGNAAFLTVETSISFTRNDGLRVSIRGPFCVFTEIESADLSILGRDVTNNFSVIYDYPNGVVALLAPPHSYEIKTT